MTLGIGGIVVVAAVAVILLLIALWMRRNLQPDDDPVDETRVVDRGFPRLPAPRRRRRFGRRPPPVDAVAAYVALLTELDGHEMLRRGPGETPIEHAARLRERGASGLGLELLAADYGLVRDGGRTLTATRGPPGDRAMADAAPVPAGLGAPGAEARRGGRGRRDPGADDHPPVHVPPGRPGPGPVRA